MTFWKNVYTITILLEWNWKKLPALYLFWPWHMFPEETLHILLLLKCHSMINIPSILTLFCNKFVTKHQYSVCTQMTLVRVGHPEEHPEHNTICQESYLLYADRNWILRDKLWFPNATWPSIWHICTTCFWWKLKDNLLGLVKNYPAQSKSLSPIFSCLENNKFFIPSLIPYCL